MPYVWTGAVSFGLINIPVKLYHASREREPKFHYLRRKDLCPIAYAKICRNTGAEVSNRDIVKAYEYEKGEYALLEDEDFKKAYPRKTSLIEMMDFVDEKEIDLKFVEKRYYLEPDKDAKKVYALLREALKKSKRAGIAKFVLRNREYLGLIHAEDSAMMMYRMRFLDELRPPKELDLPKGVAVADKELDLAVRLINRLSSHFRPEKYQDTFTEAMKGIIKERIEGKEPSSHEEAPPPTEIPDLTARLKQSLELTRHRH